MLKFQKKSVAKRLTLYPYLISNISSILSSKIFRLFKKTDNVPLCVTMVTMENKYYIFWVSVCSLRYPACKAHAPYYIATCGLPDCTIFFYITSQTARFSGKRLLNIKCVFWFSLQLLYETFLIPGGIQRYIIIHVHRPSRKLSGILVRLQLNSNFLGIF